MTHYQSLNKSIRASVSPLEFGLYKANGFVFEIAYLVTRITKLKDQKILQPPEQCKTFGDFIGRFRQNVEYQDAGK